ncbi:helix-turn-helix domain-containing protein [uncultured Gelidibacter sp.]|uniref:helix-turn-helix domain-containing protein n=1 Tax=uncultured Gelidibacter sp. TaxID=259318 RepID=UPI002615B1C2|nr:helix-turn-helix domain-containing protein [uncultured Gelidibacter sp.]
MEALKFENLPNAVAELQKGQSEILALLLNKAEQQPEIEAPINIKDVSKLTELSIPTLYSYVQRNDIPYYKKGNRLKFFKSEIIDWIKTGKQKTLKEIHAETDEFLSNHKNGSK